MDERILTSIRNHPVRYAHLMGFGKLGKIHDRWIRQMVFGQGDWTLQAFRGSYKTTSVSVALALLMILYPNIRIAFMRKTGTDTKEVVAQVKKMLKAEETMAITSSIWGVPVHLTTDNNNEITTNLTSDPRGSAQLKAAGTGGSLTGQHYDIIFTDDIVNLDDRKSRAERERVKDIYRELQNLKNRGGRIINTGTPWHIEDAFSVMPEAEKWDWRSMPDVISEREIEELKSRTTPSLFAANYELRHIPSDDVMFLNPSLGADQSTVEGGEAQVDAAYYGEDFTAFSCSCIHDGKRYVYGRMWRKHIDEVMDLIVEDCKRLRVGKVYMELNADKGYSCRAMKERGLRVVPYQENLNKHIKIVTYLKAAWPDIVFVDGTDQSYIDQICDYTEDAEHDDAPDSLASLVQRGKWRNHQPSAASGLY